MENGFLSPKGRASGKGVKERQNSIMDDSSNNFHKDLNDEPMAMEMQSPMVDQTNAVKIGRGSYPTLPTQGTIQDGNTHGKSSHANVIGESSKKVMNIRTLFTHEGNKIDVIVQVDSIRAIRKGLNTWCKFSLVKSMLNSSTGLFSFQFRSKDGLNSMLENGLWFIRNHLLILRKWNSDVDLLKEDVGNVPVWVKLHGVLVTKFSEDGLSVIATKLGTNGGTTNLVNNGANSSGSSFMNVKNSCTSTTIIDKIIKFQDILISRQAILVDEAGNPLNKVECSGDYDSEDEVASVDNDMTHSMASERVKIFLKRFKLYAIIWISEFEVTRRKRFTTTKKAKNTPKKIGYVTMTKNSRKGINGIRDVKEDASKVSEFKKLAHEFLKDVRMRRGYIGELKKLKTNKNAIGMVELLQRMQKDDREKATYLLLMANETKLKMQDKNSFIFNIKGLLMGSYVNEARCMSMVWEIQGGTRSSIGWKNLLGLRDSIKQHVRSFSFLSNWVDMDVVVNTNMKDSLKDADMVSNCVWKKLVNWDCEYPELYNLAVPILKNDLKYNVMWKTSDGVLTKFSVNKVWKELKKNEEQVDWWKRVIRLYPFNLAMISLYALCKMVRDMVIDIKDFNVVKYGPGGISFTLRKWLCGRAYKLDRIMKKPWLLDYCYVAAFSFGVNNVPLHDLEATSPPSGIT
nr:hypothetical protein [Tanacetum cinerariifolium]